MIPKTYSTFLVLEDGKICHGWSFFNTMMSVGEVVFNTGMTGYQEIITDPSYYNQIVLFTYPEIGNTGVNRIDMESRQAYIKGMIAKNICLKPSNWRMKLSLIDYIIKNKIPHVFGIDTRYLAKYLRSKGVMLACITTNLLNFNILNKNILNFSLSQDVHMVYKVTTTKEYKWLPNTSHIMQYFRDDILVNKSNQLNVAVIDYGVKLNILNRLQNYGCNITVIPAFTDYETIILSKPDGILLSNGPGDPALITSAILTIRRLVNSNIPIFGICLGHQLLSLSLRATTNKLKFGHRGLNHPSGLSQEITMTSQNHGFVVAQGTLPDNLVDVTYFNLNDYTIAGFVHKYRPCFSVQYHPEASPGPHDSDYLFKHFVDVMLAFKKSSS